MYLKKNNLNSLGSDRKKCLVKHEVIKFKLFVLICSCISNSHMFFFFFHLYLTALVKIWTKQVTNPSQVHVPYVVIQTYGQFGVSGRPLPRIIKHSGLTTCQSCLWLSSIETCHVLDKCIQIQIPQKSDVKNMARSPKPGYCMFVMFCQIIFNLNRNIF